MNNARKDIDYGVSFGGVVLDGCSAKYLDNNVSGRDRKEYLCWKLLNWFVKASGQLWRVRGTATIRIS